MWLTSVITLPPSLCPIRSTSQFNYASVFITEATFSLVLVEWPSEHDEVMTTAMFTSRKPKLSCLCWISIKLCADLLLRVLQTTHNTHAIGKRLSITEPTQSVFPFLIVFYANTPALILSTLGSCKHASKHSVLGRKKSSRNKLFIISPHVDREIIKPQHEAWLEKVLGDLSLRW